MIHKNPVYIGDKTYRHKSCETGSYKWLKHIGKKSHFYQYFKNISVANLEPKIDTENKNPTDKSKNRKNLKIKPHNKPKQLKGG